MISETYLKRKRDPRPAFFLSKGLFYYFCLTRYKMKGN